MRVLSLFFIALLAGCSLSPNASQTPTTPSYAITLKKAPSDKLVGTLAACIRNALKTHYPSASLRYTTANHYSGIIPGLEIGSPRATFEVFTLESSLQSFISLKQALPIDPNITTLFNTCL